MAELLNNRYRILRGLSSGGFGETFLAEDLNMPTLRRCVVKKLKPVADKPETFALIKDRFQREAVILEMLGRNNSQIPELYAYFVEQEDFYLVQEWIEGQTLGEQLRTQGTFSLRQTQALLLELLPVLAYIHSRQIIHRDIKPENIIIRHDDEKPVLIDFGAVKEAVGTVLNSQGNTAGSIVIGTPGFIPPEQAVGRPTYASDLYSLGMTAIYLLTGVPPQNLETDPRTGELLWQQHLAPSSSGSGGTVVSPSPIFLGVLDKAIQSHPRDRFASAEEMLSALKLVPAPAEQPTPNTIAVIPGRQHSAPQSPIPQNPIPQNPAASYPPAQPSPVPPVAPPPVRHAAPSQSQPTQVVPPPSTPASPAKSQAGGDWWKAAVLGGLVGGLVLGVIAMLRPGSQPGVSNPSPTISPSPATPSPTTAASSPTPETAATRVPETASPSPIPTEANPPTPSPVTAQATCGDSPGSGQVWYPVFIDGADVNAVRRQYCQDAVAKTRDNGTPTVQVASFSSRERAVEFAQRVGGDVGAPQTPGGAPIAVPTPVTQSPNPGGGNPGGDTNATIIGEAGSKNIRSGPGTDFDVRYSVSPGERVRVISSTRDRGGYLWYRVYLPAAGGEGWIAAQLVKVD